MKIAKRLICIFVAATLFFALFINSAFSYQEAKTQTSENVFSLGKAEAYLSVNNLSDEKQIYPTNAIPLTPEIANIGSTSFWAVLALKVPALSEPMNVDFLSNNEFEERIYPAFYTYINAPDGNLWVGNSALNKYFNYEEKYNNGKMYFMKDSYLNGVMQINSEKWTLIDVSDEFADSESGFFIYYFGLKTPLNANEKAPLPWDGLAGANFQKITYLPDNAIYTDELEDYYKDGTAIKTDLETFNKNMGIEMRLFAIQSDYNEAIETKDVSNAWEYYKNTFSMFGQNAIISVDTNINYTPGVHNIPVYLTSNVNKIQIENIDTGAKQNIDLSSVTVTKLSDDVIYVELPIEFNLTGGYRMSVINTDEKAINSVYLGYITVAEVN